jgi:hypothetical protein
VGQISEDGLEWDKNGVSMPKNAPHVIAPGYIFHGSIRPVKKNDVIAYYDEYTFRHDLGPGGSGIVYVHGRFQLKGKA